MGEPEYLYFIAMVCTQSFFSANLFGDAGRQMSHSANWRYGFTSVKASLLGDMNRSFSKRFLKETFQTQIISKNVIHSVPSLSSHESSYSTPVPSSSRMLKDVLISSQSVSREFF